MPVGAAITFAVKTVTDPTAEVLLEPVTETTIPSSTDTDPTEPDKEAKPETATVTEAGKITVTSPTSPVASDPKVLGKKRVTVPT